MRLFALAFLIISSSAIACPNLAGKYAACVSQTGDSSGSTDMVVTQARQNGAMVYVLESTDNETQERVSDTARADGKLIVVTETHDGSVIGVSTLSSCEGQTLKIAQAISIEGAEIAKIDMKITKSGKTMTINSSGSVFGAPVSDTLICE